MIILRYICFSYMPNPNTAWRLCTASSCSQCPHWLLASARGSRSRQERQRRCSCRSSILCVLFVGNVQPRCLKMSHLDNDISFSLVDFICFQTQHCYRVIFTISLLNCVRALFLFAYPPILVCATQNTGRLHGAVMRRWDWSHWGCASAFAGRNRHGDKRSRARVLHCVVFQ